MKQLTAEVRLSVEPTSTELNKLEGLFNEISFHYEKVPGDWFLFASLNIEEGTTEIPSDEALTIVFQDIFGQDNGDKWALIDTFEEDRDASVI